MEKDVYTKAEIEERMQTLFEDMHENETKKKQIQKTAPMKRTYPKMGRNSKCMCGSGKKIKHCGCRASQMFL